MSALEALKIGLEDRLRFSTPVRHALCRFKVARAALKPVRSAQEQARIIHDLCSAARLAVSESSLLAIESEIIRRVENLDVSQVDWAEFEPGIDEPHIAKGILLKPSLGSSEKGVLFVSFDNQWAKLMLLPKFAEFARRYTLIVSPTWSPPHGIVNYVFPRAFKVKIFCLISNERDLVYFPRISGNYKMVPLLASNWVDPDQYRPVPFAQKDVDIFMLANFGKYKRHHALFKALQRMPTSLRVLLIGQHNGKRTLKTLLAEAAAYGVDKRFQVVENASNEDVNRAFARSKISLILSRREGSCVAVVESMFANTPVGLYEDAEIGSRKFINDATGRFLKHHDLAGQLVDFVARADTYRPRQWVMENGVSCLSSSRRLNEILKADALASGQNWTQDIVPQHWRPDPLYYSAEDAARLRPAHAEFEREFGVRLGMPGKTI